jgi:hypothetical protein
MDARSSRNPRALRAKLVIEGYTIRGFAAAHGHPESTVKAAIAGRRCGKKSKAIVAAIRAL